MCDVSTMVRLKVERLAAAQANEALHPVGNMPLKEDKETRPGSGAGKGTTTLP